MHVMKIPFSGHALSLNQGLYLTRSIKGIRSRLLSAKLALEISAVTSIMKALSPAGKKLVPMISISMQGGLYFIGIIIGGNNLIGQIFAMILLSIWAFIQPLTGFFMMYGMDLVNVFSYYLKKLNKHTAVTEETFWTVLITIISIKFVLAALIPVLNKFLNDNLLSKYDDKISELSNKTFELKHRDNLIKGLIHDLTRPAFIISIVLMGSFFYFTGTSGAVILWKLLRAIAIALIIFVLARSKAIHGIFANLAKKNKGFKRIYDLSSQAYRKLTTP